MITRDRAETNGAANNARQRLGEVIRYYREERDLSKREVSRRCKVAESLVEQWETGGSLPGSEEWKALTRGVAHSLSAYQELYLRARKEADDEARARAQATMKEQPKVNNPSTKIATNIGDKIAAARPAPISIVRDPDPAPAPVGDSKPVARTHKYHGRQQSPPGSFGALAISKRAEYVRNLLRARPDARSTGRDSILELVRKTFGVGISPAAIELIRAEVAAECRSPNTHGAIEKPTHAEAVEAQRKATSEIASPEDIARMHGRVSPNHAQAALEAFNRTPAQMATQPTRPTSAGDIETAVQLVLEALPNLQTFTITVDEHGEASVDYQIRKVVVTTDGGSFKVRR